MLHLRPYQDDIKQQVFNAWNSNYKNVLLRMATGLGKTATFTSIIIDTPHLTTAVMVHRKELIQQISLTLAKEQVQHNIIASKKDIRGIIAAQRRELGKQFYNPNARVTVISVDTLISRQESYKNWFHTVQQFIIDEAAHVLKENKWGKAAAFFVNARGLGVTATPERLDRKGLGSHADGIFDIMVEGPSTRWGIDNGFLSKYKIAIPESDYSSYLKNNSNTSDYSKQSMIEASNKSRITGDVVDNYLKFAKGKQAILFASDVTTAKVMETKFKAKGIKAKSLDATTSERERLDTIIDFKDKKIQVLLNVDLFDEGLDIVGIECVIMARPTKSLGKMLQQVGRGLRIAPGKEYLILIDHVGNVMEHGLACANRQWTLDRIRKSGKKLNFLRICSNITCCSPYDRSLTECPWCSTPAITATRSSTDGGGKITLEQVDGDLYLLDPEQIRAMELQTQLEDPARLAQRVSNAVNGAAGLRAMNNQVERIATQTLLSEAIAKTAGEMKTFYGYKDRSIHKKFYLHFGQTITELLGGTRAEMERTIEGLEYMI